MDETAPAPPATGALPCTRCGTPVAGHEQFCAECGALSPGTPDTSDGPESTPSPSWFAHDEQLGDAAMGATSASETNAQFWNDKAGSAADATSVAVPASPSTPVPSAQAAGAFPPPAAGSDAPVVDPRQPLIDVTQPAADSAGFSATGAGGAESPYSDQLPVSPPVQGHRDLVPSGQAVPLGGWNPVAAPVVDSSAGGRTWAGYLLVIAATVVALGSFFPWAQVAIAGQIVTLTGWEGVTGGVSDGPIHLIAGVVGVVCGGLAIGGSTGMGVRITAALAGLVSLTAAALRATAFSTATSQLDGVGIDALAIMWGLWLIVAGSLIATGAALLLSK